MLFLLQGMVGGGAAGANGQRVERATSLVAPMRLPCRGDKPQLGSILTFREPPDSDDERTGAELGGPLARTATPDEGAACRYRPARLLWTFDCLIWDAHMANNKSALKRWHQSLKRRDRNRSTRSAARSAIRSAREAAGGETAPAALSAAYSALDRAAKKGAIHAGKADRTKRRLAAMMAKAG